MTGYLWKKSSRDNEMIVIPNAIKELDISTKYRVHRVDLCMTADQITPEQLLSSLEGKIIAIIPKVTVAPFILTSRMDFLLTLGNSDNLVVHAARLGTRIATLWRQEA